MRTTRADSLSSSSSSFASLATPSKRPSPSPRGMSDLVATLATVASTTHQEHRDEAQMSSSSGIIQCDEACYVDFQARFDIIGKLPAEISFYIFSLIDDYRDVVAASAVSNLWRTYALHSQLWHRMFCARSHMGWSVIDDAERIWPALLHTYGRKWTSKEAVNDDAKALERLGISERLLNALQLAHSIPENPFKDLVDASNIETATQYGANMLSEASREVLAGPMHWFHLFKARYLLSNRWDLSNELTEPVSQDELEEDEEARWLSSDDWGELSEDYSNDPNIMSTIRAAREQERRTKRRNGAPPFLPGICYLQGHRDSVYCVRLDSKPFKLPAAVEAELEEKYKRAPLYDPTASLGLGSRGTIFSGSRDKTIKIWDGDSGLCLHTLEGHKGSVLCLEFDDSILLSGSSDQTVLVWDLTSLQQGKTPVVLKRLRGHTAGVLDLAMTERYVISCGKDAMVRVYDRQQGFAVVRVYNQHRGPVNAGSLSWHRGRMCAVTASGEGSIQLWDLLSGKLLRTFDGHSKGLACVKFAGNIVVSGSNDHTVRAWNASTGECLVVCHGHKDLVRAIAFDHRRKIIVSAGYDGCVKLFDVQRETHPDAAIAEGGFLIAASTDLPPFDDNRAARVFDVQADGTRILSCGENSRICVRDYARDTPIMRILA